MRYIQFRVYTYCLLSLVMYKIFHRMNQYHYLPRVLSFLGTRHHPWIGMPENLTLCQVLRVDGLAIHPLGGTNPIGKDLCQLILKSTDYIGRMLTYFFFLYKLELGKYKSGKLQISALQTLFLMYNKYSWCILYTELYVCTPE